MEMVKPYRPVQIPDTLLTPQEDNVKKKKKKYLQKYLQEDGLGLNTPQIMQEAQAQYLSFDVKVCQKTPGMASAWLLSDLKVPDVRYAQRNSRERGIPKSTLNTNKTPAQVLRNQLTPCIDEARFQVIWYLV